MTILPREQVIQRHPQANVSAPGVVLWTSQTDLALCDVDVTDEVSFGEVEVAIGPAPQFNWRVITESYGFGFEPFGEEPFGLPTPYEKTGVYQDTESGDAGFEGYVEHGPTYWGDGAGENGVYP